MIMESFFITPDEFWNWFNRDPTCDVETEVSWPGSRLRPQHTSTSGPGDFDGTPANKKMRKDGRPRHLSETEAGTRGGKRYDIIYGRHRPGKKTKVWEADGYLTLIGQTAYLSKLDGKMLEEPTVLDEVDMKDVEDLSEILIGETEVQIVDVSK